jgi:hypothetical protein
MKELDLVTQKQICDLYTAGHTGLQISKLLDKNIKTIYKVLNKNSLTKPPQESHRQFHINENYFDYITTPRQAYWLGFISGDGSVTDDRLIINLSFRDESMLAQLNQDLSSDYKIHRYGNFSNLNILSTNLVKSLNYHNIFSNKTQTFSISNHIPNNLMNSYILGFNDADGCFSIDKTRGLRFSLVGTETSMKQIRNILIEECQVNENKLQNHHSTSYIKYLVYSGDKQLMRIAKYLYKENDFCLLRKFDIVKNYFNLPECF